MAQDRTNTASARLAPAARAPVAGRPSWVWRRAADAVIVVAGIALALPLIVLGS